jgi:RNA polymerase sigma-70 factor (ECF subfamily)
LSDHTIHIDQQLLLRIAKGDEKAFRTVYDHFYNGLYFYAHKLTGNREEAEDITLQAFTKLFERAKELENDIHMRRWLYITVRNAAIDYLKKGNHLQEQPFEWQKMVLQEQDMEEVMIENEMIRRLYEAIEALPDQRKKIFRMIYIEGLKAREVAALLNISENTVNTQKKRALATLRSTVPTLLLFIMALKK